MNFFNELKRRNVIRVGAAYIVLGWLLLQIADTLTPALHLPEWIASAIALVLILGLIPVLLFSWAYELTSEGLKRDSDVDQTTSDTSQTAKKLDVVTIVAVAGVVALIGWQQLNPPASTPVSDQSIEQTVDPQPALENKTDENVAAASIAVLPFSDLSREGDQGYFSDGVSEEILNVLAKIEGLRVASRTSAFAYKNSQQRIPEIAGELGVRHILEGSVRRAGETIRVTAQLIDAETDEHLLSETFDRTLTTENVFAIQGEIAQLIVTALGERIEIAGVDTPIVVTADTANLTTLDLYYEANALFIMRGRENLARALNLFEQITVKDPDFARGWAGLAAVYGVGRSWGLTPRDFYELAINAANRAIALNPKLSTPYSVLANVEHNSPNPDWSLVVKNFNLALQHDPDDPNLYNWRALFWESAGFTERAFADYETCLRLAPSYLNCGYNKHALLVAVGRAQEAAELNRLLMLKGTALQFYLPTLVQQFANHRDDDDLLIALNLMVANSYPDQPWMVKELYQAFTEPNFNHVERLKSFEKRRDSSIAATDNDHSGATDRTTILLAFRDFDRAILPPDGITFSTISFFDGISDAQKRRLAIDSGLPKFWREQGFPPQCRAVANDDFECD